MPKSSLATDDKVIIGLGAMLHANHRPTLRDIAAVAELAGPSSAAFAINRLERRGLVIYPHERTHRRVVLSAAGEAAYRRLLEVHLFHDTDVDPLKRCVQDLDGADERL